MENVLSKIAIKGKREETPDIVVNEMINAAIEGLFDNRASHIEKDYEEVLLNYETIYRRLDLSNDPERKAAYDYGRMYALAVLLREASVIQKERASLDGIKYKSKYLEKALEFVESKGSVSGKELSNALEMKNRSDLSNFMNRIKEYKLFRSVPVGNKKHYSLSTNGRKYVNYLKAKGDSSFRSDDVDFFFSLLDNLGEELRDDKPSTFALLVNTNRKVPNNTVYQSRILKKKIDNIIEAYDVKIKEQLHGLAHKHSAEKYETINERYYLMLGSDNYL